MINSPGYRRLMKVSSDNYEDMLRDTLRRQEEAMAQVAKERSPDPTLRPPARREKEYPKPKRSK